MKSISDCSVCSWLANFLSYPLVGADFSLRDFEGDKIDVSFKLCSVFQGFNHIFFCLDGSYIHAQIPRIQESNRFSYLKPLSSFPICAGQCRSNGKDATLMVLTTLYTATAMFEARLRYCPPALSLLECTSSHLARIVKKITHVSQKTKVDYDVKKQPKTYIRVQRNIYIGCDAFKFILANDSQSRNFMAAAQPRLQRRTIA